VISASLNRCKGMEDQVGDFLKQLAAKLELVLLIVIECHTKWLTLAESKNFKGIVGVYESNRRHAFSTF